MIHEYSKDFEFEYHGMLVEFLIEYNLEYEYDEHGGRMTNATDIVYSPYVFTGEACLDRDSWKELDRIASDMVEEAQLN